MKIIYEPQGRAKEYAELACNLYMGCSHNCKYCYAPRTMRKTFKEWQIVTPRKDVLKLLDEDAKFLCDEKDGREVLFSFISDPFNPQEYVYRITHSALKIMGFYGIRHTVLTKGHYDLVSEYFDLMKDVGTSLGVSLSYIRDDLREFWEPNASPVSDRLRILQEAHKRGISTWVSLEPVIYPDEALSVIEEAHNYVNFWKVGKLNHCKFNEDKVDWKRFLYDVVELLDNCCATYYIKKDLEKYGSPGR